MKEYIITNAVLAVEFLISPRTLFQLPLPVNKNYKENLKMDKAQREAIVAKFARKPGDTGSPEVQVALLTARIVELTAHLKENPKDHSTRRGLLAMVALRKKQLAYLMREDYAKYIELTDALSIRRTK